MGSNQQPQVHVRMRHHFSKGDTRPYTSVELAAKFGVTRAVACKAIRKMQRDGWRIEITFGASHKGGKQWYYTIRPPA